MDYRSELQEAVEAGWLENVSEGIVGNIPVFPGKGRIIEIAKRAYSAGFCDGAEFEALNIEKMKSGK